MSNNRTLAFSLAIGALTLTSGCGFMADGMLHNLLTGERPDRPIGAPMAIDGHGTSVVCFGTDAELSDQELQELSFTIDGVVLSSNDQAPEGFDNVSPCWTTPEVTMTVRDSAGDTWTVGYAWLSSDGWDMTPWVSAYQGDRVELILSGDSTVGSEAAGMAVVADGEVIYVLESGRNGQGLRDGDVPGLQFAQGGVVGSRQDDCGTKDVLSQRFDSDQDELEMYPGEDTSFELGDSSITTCSIDSWAYQDDCGEPLLGESSFVMFR